MALILPGTPAWRKLTDPRDRYKALTDLCVAEQQEKSPDFEKLEQWASARLAYNAAVVQLEAAHGLRDWDSRTNVHITLDAMNRARQYRRKSIQRMIAKFIQERRHRQIWAVIWKYRQGGVSTEISQSFYLDTARDPGIKTLVVAQADPEATVIFNEKYRFFYEHDPLAPEHDRSNTEELNFPSIGSQIRVRSAGGRKGVGRGGNLKRLHLSEVAWYPGNPYELAGGLFQGVTDPTAQVFLESTANGQSGFFYEKAIEALNAENDRREGRIPEKDTEWEPIFLPWFWEDEARRGRPFKSEAEHEHFKKSLRDDEKLQQQEFELADEVMNWYRYIFNTKIGGETEEAKILLLAQEYPARPLDAFVAAGSCAFSTLLLTNRALAVKAPTVHNIESTNFDAKRARFDVATPLVRPTRADKGPLLIWKHPKPGHRYAMGVDLAASGAKKADFTEMWVIDCETEEAVALYMVQQDPLLSLGPCRLLWRYYNKALIVPETNFTPSFTAALADTDCRDSLYVRMQRNVESAKEQWIATFGFDTRQDSKRDLVFKLREALEFKPGYFASKRLIDQMKTYVQVQSDKTGTWTYPGALPGSGNKDDSVQAMMLALKGREQAMQRMPPPKPLNEEPKPVTVADRLKGHLEYEQTQRDQVQEGW